MSGYIGQIPIPQATERREAFTATSGQTSFATIGYTPGFVSVFLNGVKLLDGTDYTATNGSDVVLTSGAAASDVLEVISYSTYEVNSQNYTGGLTVDNDGATVLTVDRATSDGTIIDFQKDGSSVGSIGSKDSNLFIGTGDTGVRFSSGTNSVFPIDTSTGNGRDAAVDLGLGAGGRYKDLYLSGGVYLGGTGAANKLDRYEEGTWTLTCTAFNIASGLAYYRVIGDVCYAWFYISGVTNINSNAVQINLPFTSSSTQGYGSAGSVFVNYNNISPTSVWVSNNATVASFYNSVSTQSNYTEFAGGNIYAANNSNFAMYGQFQYRIA